MLKKITIRDFALIEFLELDFHSEMSSLTGDSGSGKSLVLDALSNLLGARSNPLNIRSGSSGYKLTAEFTIAERKDILLWLMEKGIPTGDSLVLHKELSTDGKLKILINNALSPSGLLREVGSLLAEFFRQGEQNTLFERDKQLEILDSYAGTTALRTAFQLTFQEYRTWKHKLEEARNSIREKETREDFFRYQLEELEKANLQEGEEESLLEEEKFLLQGEKISSNLSYISEILAGEEGGVLDGISKILYSLEKIQSFQKNFANWKVETEESYSGLKELQSLIQEEVEDLFYSTDRLETVQARLDQLGKLRKKYGKSISELIQYREELSCTLEESSTSNESIEFLEKKFQKSLEKLTGEALALSNARRLAIPGLESEIPNEFNDLGLKDSKLQIVMRWEAGKDGDLQEGDRTYMVSENGLDQVEFYFSANPGEKPRPLRKIASGGEISRIFLALKILNPAKTPTKLLVFDEIDSGISGEVVQKVSEKLRKVSKHQQILLITHQQTIAAASPLQIKVFKEVKDSRTFTMAAPIRGEERTRELAKMISGDTITKGALEHARELLKKKVV
ncbi:MAG: DNA repair protein RecN [Leptospiraceae bacterium]|nr:DNA repair protein RecN [Leptospiraceae bacterium]MCP5513471.1 DNA repair protein RecN [Leptospiraceae bacterium]